jgi:hypothetical protein
MPAAASFSSILQSSAVILLLTGHLSTCHAAAIDAGLDDTANTNIYDPNVDSGVHGSYPVLSFHTTKAKAPRTNFQQRSPECVSNASRKEDYYFITPKGHKVASPGPMILDASGGLVWTEHFANEFGGQAYNLQVQEYQGESYLTFWLGDDRIRGHGDGYWYMLNSSYDIVHRYSAANNRLVDLHEFTITPEGTALMMMFDIIPFDVRPLGRKWNDVWNQAIWDNVFQEVNLSTGETVFEWRASDHVNMTTTYRTLDDPRVAASGKGDSGTLANPFDWFHQNSIEKDDLGNYLICARYPHAIYYIDGRTGAVIWTLGGKDNRFVDLSDASGHALNFAWQHDARFVSPSTFPSIYTPPPAEEGFTTKLLTLFDNAADDWDYTYGPPYARGLLLELTYPTPGSGKGKGRIPSALGQIKTPAIEQVLSKEDSEKVSAINGTEPSYIVRVVQEYINPLHPRSSSQGSMTLLPPLSSDPESQDPQILLGYGINPVISTFASNGTELCSLHFGAKSGWETGDIQSYRVYKASGWVGRSRTPLAIAASGDQIYASWNGATEVQEWLLQVSQDRTTKAQGQWIDVLRTAKTGFETAVTLSAEYRSARYIRFMALDSEGKVLKHGVSDVLERGYFRTSVLRQNAAAAGGGIPYIQPALVVFANVVVLYLIRRFFQRLNRKIRSEKAGGLLAR